ncbi:hypothetical protein B5M42_007150 [Paenibacillus athensensis]|uniref:CBM-cenC domain-containing protein n=1 Tax=Paenibacillus athensensis TaxID=1967502 RepID=A0A4Y8PST1_9BACL|nr:carbohydrate binding domain-containing protein [Paenibacillus athensensis]MCD1258608.1 hypothetical protein [Paenibacillus athensensis]
MIHKKYIIAAALGLGSLLASSGAAAEGGANALLNASFEERGAQGPAAWTTTAWDASPGSADFALETEAAACHSGASCAKLTNVKDNDARYVQEVPVAANAMYKLSAWIKAQGVGTGHKGASLSVEGKTVTTSDVAGSDDGWHYVEMYAITREQATTLRLTLGLGGYGQLSTGAAWFDDAAVEPVSAVPPGATVVYLPDDPPPAANAAGLPQPPNAAASAGSSGWHPLSRGPRTGLWVGLSALLAVLAGMALAYRRLASVGAQPPRRMPGKGGRPHGQPQR